MTVNRSGGRGSSDYGAAVSGRGSRGGTGAARTQEQAVSMYDGWFMPAALSRQTAEQSALVIITDTRAAVATTLILQEMGLSVDLGAEPIFALRWLAKARYDVVVTGGPEAGERQFLSWIRRSAPASRILVIPEPGLTEADAIAHRAERLEPPVDVNQLVARFLGPPG